METWVIPLLTFLLGLGLGHRLALWRDRRKEFNEIAEPLRSILLRESAEPVAFGPAPTLDELDRFTQVLPWCKRSAFSEAWSAYEKAKQGPKDTAPHSPVMVYEDPEAVKRAAEKVLPFTKRR